MKVIRVEYLGHEEGGHSTTTILLLWSTFFLFGCSTVNAIRNGHSTLKLFQGAIKYKLDAKDCPVGVAFHQPERFSCACINGIWAFYDHPCHSPIAIIGGQNHCFQMPSQAISFVLVVSNPLRAHGQSLTAFDGDMEGIRAKVYRNIHTNLDEADKFIILNSSWTLSSPDGSKSICLESRNVVFEGLTSEEAAIFPDLTYCSFAGVSTEMPFIGSLKKGCDSSMVLEPVECQPVLPSTDEESVCLNQEVIDTYKETNQTASNGNLDPATIDENDGESNVDNSRLSRALTSLGKFASEEKMSEKEQIRPDSLPKFESVYFEEPEWHQRWLASKGPEYFQQMNSTPHSPVPEEKLEIDTNKLWKNPESFFSPNVNSGGWNQLISNHLWTHQRFAIRDILNITRLLPPDKDDNAGVADGKMQKLLQIHADIMKRICPLAPESFFDTVVGTFGNVLTKGFRWKEPYLEQAHYSRISSSLTACKNRAEIMRFVNAESGQCAMKNPSYITLSDTTKQSSINIRLEIPELFKSGKFEPVIESVWKTFVTVHSYCYKDFQDQYQDHHRYTNLMVQLFSNQVHDIWMGKKANPFEYAGVLGNLAKTLGNLASCATGARMTSNYPYHLNRPKKLSIYQNDNEVHNVKKKSRQRRSIQFEAGEDFLDQRIIADAGGITSPLETQKLSQHLQSIRSRKKRLATNIDNSEHASGNDIFNGKGICLRKYTEARSTVGKNCKGHNK